jgi:hypothetical protein
MASSIDFLIALANTLFSNGKFSSRSSAKPALTDNLATPKPSKVFPSIMT